MHRAPWKEVVYDASPASRGSRLRGARGWGLGLVVTALLGLSWVGMGYGAPGDLDPTFGTGGIAVSFGPKDLVRAMVQQPDGKLVVAGTSLNQSASVGFILLVRYLSDGRGEPTFGSGGKVTVPVGSSSSANALVLWHCTASLEMGRFWLEPSDEGLLHGLGHI